MSSIKSRIASQYDYYHFIVFGIVLLGLAVKFILISILLLLYLLFLWFKKRDTFWWLVVIILLFLVHLGIKEVNYYVLEKNDSHGIVLKVLTKDQTNKYLVGLATTKQIIYTDVSLTEGDEIKFFGEAQQYKVHYRFGFDYESYLHFQNIRGVSTSTKVVKASHIVTPFYIHEAVNSYLDNHFDGLTRVYLKVFITGDSTELDKTELNNLGISHLFVISGLHVSLLLLIIQKITKLLRINKKGQIIISLFFLTNYIFLTAFLVSVLRVAIGYLLKRCFKTSRLDLISLNFIILILLNPYYLWQSSFILSYAIAFFLSIYQSFKITKIRLLNKLLNMWILTCLIQLFTLPIVSSFNPNLNILSMLINPFYILVVSYLVLPLSIITTICPPLSFLYEAIITLFQESVNHLSHIKALQLSLGNINIYFKIVYYVVFYLTLKAIYLKKYYLLVMMPFIIGLWYGKGIFQLETQIAFYDLKVGDACLITTPHQLRTIVIDTSDQTKNNEMAMILANEGVRKIDYLILTHHDSDHSGGAFDLVGHIKTKRLITSRYEASSLAYLNEMVGTSYYLKAGDELNDDLIHLKVLSPSRDFGNPNDNSLVFVLNVGGVSLLNMGDASTKVEKELLHTPINVDLYKVAHHGSITSTSTAFIKHIGFRYAVIMNGYGNQFGFPSETVVSRFDERLLTTKNEQTIYFKAKHGVLRRLRNSRVLKLI